METKRIDGFLLEKLLYNGLASLILSEETLNSLNVFPVADGDTGTNMRLTLENGLAYAPHNAELGEYMSALSEGMLLGARGNSGVILSQLFRGAYTYLSAHSCASARDMQSALVSGYKTAYRAVIEPVEGTILTVAREGIENIELSIGDDTTIEELFAAYLAQMRSSLENTPELLDVLKASGVIDSGALGYITVIDGMYKYLLGEEQEITAPLRPAPVQGAVSYSAFTEDSDFNEGYCMEFILQLLKSDEYDQSFTAERYVDAIKPLGESIAVTRDKMRVKVHIHTKKPAPIIALSQQYGEFLTFKLENMQLQRNERTAKKQAEKGEKKPLGIVAVYSGEGMRAEFEGLGCDVTIDGGVTMNPPSSEFVAAYDSINAESIVVLPNSKNVIRAAEQAIELSGRKNVTVLPTKSVAEGYFAIAMDVGNDSDVLRRIESIKSGAEGVTTLSVARATRHYADDDVTCEPGDYIAVVDDKVVCSAASPVDAFIGGLKHIEDVGDRETCMVFCGEGADEELNDALTEAVEDEYSMELSFADGGQHTYVWICGII